MTLYTYDLHIYAYDLRRFFLRGLILTRLAVFSKRTFCREM